MPIGETRALAGPEFKLHIQQRFGLIAKGIHSTATPAKGKPTTANPNGLPMVHWRPQATETLLHSEGYKTKVTSLIDGGQIFDQIDTLLTNAKKSVLVDMYEIQDPLLHPNRTAPAGTPGADKQQKLLKHLIDLAKSGVSVKVVLDNSFDNQKKEYHNQKTIDYLRANGVEALIYPTDSAKINHVKLLVVDGKYGVIGGMNWGNHSPANHDACVILEGDDVGNLIGDIFKVDYQFAGGDVKTLPAYKTIPQEKIKVLTTSQCGSPDGGQSEIYEEILSRIDNAQKSVICELFTVTDKLLAQKLIDTHNRLKAANQPGVRVIVDPGLYLKFANCRPVVDMLKNQGVPIRFYKVDWSQEQKLHAKWGVFDDEQLIVGSANWSKTGLQSNCPTPGHTSQLQFMKGNHEAGVSISSKEVCKAFVQQFNYDWSFKKSIPWRPAGSLYRSIPQDVRSKMFADSDTHESIKKFVPFKPRQFNPFSRHTPEAAETPKMPLKTGT